MPLERGGGVGAHRTLAALDPRQHRRHAAQSGIGTFPKRDRLHLRQAGDGPALMAHVESLAAFSPDFGHVLDDLGRLLPRSP